VGKQHSDVGRSLVGVCGLVQIMNQGEGVDMAADPSQAECGGGLVVIGASSPSSLYLKK
jgi:hypothetical protein